MTREEQEAQARAAGATVRQGIADAATNVAAKGLAVKRGVEDVKDSLGYGLGTAAEGMVKYPLMGMKTATDFTGGLLGLGGPAPTAQATAPSDLQFTAAPVGGAQFTATKSGSPQPPVGLKPQVVAPAAPAPVVQTVTKPPVVAPTVSAPNPVTATGIPGVVRQGNTYSREGEAPLTGGGVSVVPAFKPPAVEAPDLTRDMRGNLIDEINKAGMRRERDVAAKNQLAQSELQLKQTGENRLNEMAQARLGLDQQEALRAQARDALAAEAAGLTLAEGKRRAGLIQKLDKAKTEGERRGILAQISLAAKDVAQPKFEKLTVDDNGVKTERMLQIDPTTGATRDITPRTAADYNRMADQMVAAKGLTGDAAAKFKAEILATAQLTK